MQTTMTVSLIRKYVLAGLLSVAGAISSNAVTNLWQGGDGNWTDANWTVGGVANQTVAAPPTIYSNLDFRFSLTDSLLIASGRPALDGGSWVQDAGMVNLTGGGNSSGASFGHNGTPTAVVLSGDAELDVTGSGSAGSAFVGRAGTLVLSNSAAIVCNNLDFEIQNGFTVSLWDNASITAPYIYFSSGGAANALLTFTSGTITLTSSNPLQTPSLGSSPPGNRVNFTGPAGAAQVINTDNSNASKNLLAKMTAGFFCIDGVVVNDTSTYVNGRRFNLTTAGTTDTLKLVTAAGGTLAITNVPGLPVPTLVQNPVSVSAGSTRVSSANTKGQTISFTNGVSITNLVLKLDETVTSLDLSGVITLEIYRTLNGLPFGAPVFSDAGALPAGLTNGAWLQITPATAVDLVAGRYAFVLSSADADIDFKLSTGEAYAGGALIRIASGNWAFGSTAGTDFVFGVQGVEHVDPAPPVNRPNIIVILADDLGWTDISAPGPNIGNISDYHQTPNLARLAQQGLSFNSCYVNPNCAPTRAALLSGKYACRTGNGVYNVDDLNRGNGTPSLIGPPQNKDVPSSTHTIAEMLRDAGYSTAHLGKWHVGGHEGGSATLPLSQGFDWNFGGNSTGNPGNYEASALGVFTSPGPELDAFGLPYTLSYINTNLLPFTNGFSPQTINGNNKHLEDAEADAAVAYIGDHLTGPQANRPFYLQWHSYAVHTPVKSRADIKTKYDSLPPGANHTKSAYAGLVEGLDQAIGRVMKFLDDPNGDGNTSDSIATNTLVVFFSDNGGEESQTKNNPLRAWKGSHYEGGLRVPLIVRWPGRVPTNQVTSTMVQHVDIYPTLMQVAGGVQIGSLDGVSFAAHMTNPIVPRARSPIFYHFPGYLDDRARPCSTIIKEVGGKRYKLIYNYDYTYDPSPGDNIIKVLTQPWELYNISDDLSETKNLIDGTYSGWLIEGKIADEMAADLNAWLTKPDVDWDAKQPTYRVGGGVVPYAPASVPDVAPPGGNAFRVTDTQINQATKQATLTWNSETGFVYSVWASSNLQSWSLLQGNIPPTGSSTSKLVSDAAIGSGPRYYRIGVNRP